MLTEKWVDVCEKMGWDVYGDEEWVEVRNTSSGGEDVIFSLPYDNFVREFFNTVAEIDDAEYADVWGEEAEEIKEMVNKLVDALSDLN